MDIVLSGIRPTGRLHLGNYYGAVQNFVKIQEQYHCFLFIADLHALTTHPSPKDVHGSIKQVLIEYLAAGIDPEKVSIYIQSSVPEISELYLYLNMHAYLGELERSTSFKDKVRTQPNNVNAGLLTYPVLMAADILIHRATKVPVGKDQEQHLEMARIFANRFNRLYSTNYFPEPYAFNFSEQLIKVPGLDGKNKMSKSTSSANAVYLSDTPEVIRKKVMRAVSDSGPTVKQQTKTTAVQNLFDLMRLVSNEDVYQHFERLYDTCQIRYNDLKKQLAEDIIAVTEPIRKQIQAISQDEHYLQAVMHAGTSKARESACKTIREVKAIIGLKGF